MDASQVKDKKALGVSSKDLEAIHKEGLTRFGKIEDKEQPQRELAVEDIYFAQSEDGMWADRGGRSNNFDGSSDRAKSIRPRYTLNKVAAAVDQIVGDQRANDVGANVRPAAGTATTKLAETFNGLILNIESVSSAQNAYDSAFDEALNGGYGGWRYTTKFNDNDTFEQDIVIEPIDSATTSLWFDPTAKKYDKRDAMYAYVTSDISEEEHKARWPGKTVSSVDIGLLTQANSSCKSWFRDDAIRIAEYWRKIPVDKTIVQMSDGSVYDKDEEFEKIIDELKDKGITVLKEREVPTWKIERYIMNGATILEGPHEWAGKYFPLIPLYGKITHVEGNTLIRGLIRFAKDPSRLYNSLRSMIADAGANAPIDPLWMTPKQAQGHSGTLSKINDPNHQIQYYNNDPAAPGVPQRTGAPSIQQGWIEEAQTAAFDITTAMGVTAGTAQPMAGVDRRSAEAIHAQQQRGDVGAFIYTDNYIKSREYGYVVLVDLIPRIIDTERQVRIMQPDGTSELVTVNKTIRDEETGDNVVLNDLSQGKYDVVASSGPAFATQRDKAAEQLIELATNPAFANDTADLIAKNLDIPGGDELFKRLRKRGIRNGSIDPTEEEIEEMGLDGNEAEFERGFQEGAAAQLQEANTRLLNSNADNLDADSIVKKSTAEVNLAKAANTDVDSNKKANEAMLTMLEGIQKQLEMGIPVDDNTRDNRAGQVDLVEDTQNVIDPEPNSNQQDLVQAIEQGQIDPNLPPV